MTSNQSGELVRLLRQRYEDEGDTISRKTAEQIAAMTAEEFEDYFGARCEQYDPHCVVCINWRNRDLTAALRDLLAEIGGPIWMHPRGKYGEYQIPPEAIDEARDILDQRNRPTVNGPAEQN